MKIFPIALLAFSLFSLASEAQTNAVPTTAPDQTVETIVCIRHGEKPPGGLGQLTCRGLNRSLALPKVLLGKFGKPQFIFAPNPTEKSDGDKYNYIRPLATIEPTAIRCGLPVNTEFGMSKIKELETELDKSEYSGATVFIAWEHGLLDEFARNMVQDNGGDAAQVPAWPKNDFDSIFVLKITVDHGRKSISFAIDHEGLNGLSDAYPGSDSKQ